MEEISIEIPNKSEEKQEVKNEQLEQELFADIFKKEEELINSAKRLVQMGDNSLQFADDCNKLLSEQDQKFDEMIQNIDIIESHTVRAKREISTLLRSFLADKLLLSCLCLVLFLVSVIILWKILDFAGVWKMIKK